MNKKKNFNNSITKYDRLEAIGILVIAAVIILSSGAESAGNSEQVESDKIEITRTALEKYIENKRIISKEKRDLALAREMLNERISLVEHEIGSLREKKNDAEKSIAEADKKREEMLNENEKLKDASDSLVSFLEKQEESTRSLIKRLPDPIRNRIKPLSQRLPDKTSDKSKLTISERFQNIVGILNEVDKFNREITVASEVRKLEDGTSMEVTSVYIGIGQAYYAAASGNVAGIAVPTENGFEWKQANYCAEQVRDVISILNNEKAATYVQLPVDVK